MNRNYFISYLSFILLIKTILDTNFYFIIKSCKFILLKPAQNWVPTEIVVICSAGRGKQIGGEKSPDL